ncbi:MAG: hypothetical protein HOP15_00070 [Planctomycetes bacterium]|nr:hypothetical protein [Planctomycetota bacterium]
MSAAVDQRDQACSTLDQHALSALAGGETDIQALLEAYKRTLFTWVSEQLRRDLDSTSAEQWARLFCKAGSPSQSYFLYRTCTGANSSAILCERLRGSMEAEIRAFDSGIVLRASVTPWWLEAYFGENAELLADPMARIDLRNPQAARRALARAHTLLALAWPPALAQVRATIERVVYYRGQLGGFTGSTPRAFGAVFLTQHGLPPAQLACTLVHETAHHLLHVIRSLSPLHAEPDDTPCFSPFRRETRPLLGVVHSGYALARMIVFLQYAIPHVQGRQRHYALRKLTEYRVCIRDTCKQLSSVRWTLLGKAAYSFIERHSCLTTGATV